MELHIINKATKGKFTYYPGCKLAEEILKIRPGRSCYTIDDLIRFSEAGLEVTYGGDVDRSLDRLKIPYTGKESIEVESQYARRKKRNAERAEPEV